MVKTGDNNHNKMLGSEGADTLDGAGGDDTISGVGGNDSLIGSGGADSIDGGAGNDILNGGAENDVLIGGTGNDVLLGDTGNDTLKGGDGADTLDGGIGDDSMEGGGGNDFYIVNSIRDKVIETTSLKSVDTVKSSATFVLPNLVENLELTGSIDLNGTGNKLNNKITGNNADNLLTGLDGQDTLRGGDGADTLDGGAGVDSLEGGADDDIYIITSTGDKVVETGSGGDEDEVRSSVDFTLANNVEVLTLTGTANLRGAGNDQINILNGNGGANELNGNKGDDTIMAGAGDDRVDGGKGDDELDGGDGDDSAVYAGIFDGYQITFDEEGQSYIIEDIDDSDGNEGVDKLINFEHAEFSDQIYDFPGVTPPELPTLSIGDVTKPEGTSTVPTKFDFPVTLSEASDTEVTVDYAIQGSGVNAKTGVLTFTAGSTQKTISVEVDADSIDEPDQTFTVQLSNASGATLDKSVGTGTIQDDDEPPVLLPALFISGVQVLEGDSGTKDAILTVTLSSASLSPVMVSYATADGTATAGSDYTAASGRLVFLPNQTSQQIKVAIGGDTNVEPNETLQVNLSSPTGAVLGTTSATLTIENDDVVAVSISNASVQEGDSGATMADVTVSLSEPSDKTVTVNYATANGTATAGSDYTAASGMLVFTSGQTTQSIKVAVTGDTVVEPDEIVRINLSAPTNAKLGASSGAMLTIVNDDMPTVSIAGASVNEGSGGTTTAATLTVSLSAPSDKAVTVNYATVDGTAMSTGNANDYDATSGTLTFAPGETSKAISVTVNGDATYEENETFTVQLSAPSHANLGTASASVTINNDDSRGPTPEDDVLDGTEVGDEVDALSGNDVVDGKGGNDTLIGNDGDDSLIGGDGDDQVLGGDGNDMLTDGSGNNTLSGGVGDDQFVIDGRAPGTTLIEDIGGTDTIDAANATSGVVINLTPGQTSTIGGQTITLSTGGTITDPLDMFFLQDLTGSFSDDITTVRKIVPQVVSAIHDFQPDSMVGLGSFMDKPISPFGTKVDYVYRTDLNMTTDQAAFSSALNSLVIGDGYDGPESQLEALLQVALHVDDIGFRSEAVKTVVIMTDASYHRAGDGKKAGITTPNNGDGILDGLPEGTGEDYPSVDMTAIALKAAGIVPIFAVTSGNESTYNDLVSKLGIGSVVTLTSNSSNLVSVIQSGIGKATVATVENAIGSDFADTLNGDANANTLDGRSGADTLNGGNGNDNLLGGASDDSLLGVVGNDTLNGGAGVDVLNGGAGNDRFVFDVDDSGSGAGNRDVISDFTATSTSEFIDLSLLSDSPLTFVGTANFTGTGQVRYVQDAGSGITVVQVNLDDAGVASLMEIQLTGVMALSGGDFILT